MPSALSPRVLHVPLATLRGLGSDVVVIGAGPAGCVVARNLADAGRTVTLVEAGPGRPHPQSLGTVDALDALAEPDRFWPGLHAAAVPPRLGMPYRIGHGVGGGSAVNPMVMTTGDRADYDRWDHHWGATGWGWSGFGPWFDHLGRRFTTEPAPIGPLADAVRSSIADRGGAVDGFSADIDQWGFTTASLATRRGQRHGVAEAFIDAPPSGRGIELVSGATVRRVVFSGRRTTGVELADGSRIDAGMVVLSAGAINSPTLLRASGVERIGDERPILDHPSFVFTVALRPDARCPTDREVAPISGLVRWSSSGRGLDGRALARGDGQDDGHGEGDGGIADLMAFVMDHVGSGPEGRRYGAIVLVLADVTSVGSLGWRGDRVHLDPGWLGTDLDRRRLVAGARQIAALLGSGPVMAQVEGVYVDAEGTTLDAFDHMTDGELGQWLASHPGPVAHPAASCSPVLAARPGSGSGDGVVDLHGAVRDRQRLYVIDGSTLPYLPVANPQLPIMALADRLSSGY